MAPSANAHGLRSSPRSKNVRLALHLLAKLRASFEDSFRYDASGVPRVWKPEEDIDGVLKKARDAPLDFILLYAKISPTD